MVEEEVEEKLDEELISEDEEEDVDEEEVVEESDGEDMEEEETMEDEVLCRKVVLKKPMLQLSFVTKYFLGP